MPEFPIALDVTFTAPVTPEKNSGWACVLLQNSFEILGTGKSVKVRGTVDGHDYEATMMSSGGVHMLPLRASFRKQIGKQLGDEVTVHLTERVK